MGVGLAAGEGVQNGIVPPANGVRGLPPENFGKFAFKTLPTGAMSSKSWKKNMVL